MGNQVGMKNRNVLADVVKGILILCVLYGHSVTMINSLRGVTWVDSIVNVFVTSFEMPLFILVSGYFLAFSLRSKPYKTVLWKRIVSIALPLIIWEGLPALYSFVITTVEQGFAIKNVAKIVYKCVFPGKLWFLAAYLICSVLVIGVEWLCSAGKQEKTRKLCSLSLYGILVVVLQLVSFSMSNVQFLFSFFLMGFLLAKYELLKKAGIQKLIWILAALFVVLYPFYKGENSFYLLGTYIAPERLAADLPVILHRFVLSVCGCSAVYFIASVICKHKKESKGVNILSKLGENTMELYILSMYVQDILCELAKVVFKDISVITDLTAPLVFGPVFLVIMIAVCLGADYLLKKLPALHRILFGR